jgi:hypothetical protein
MTHKCMDKGCSFCPNCNWVPPMDGKGLWIATKGKQVWINKKCKPHSSECQCQKCPSRKWKMKDIIPKDFPRFD